MGPEAGSFALRVLLHYANARPTERNWRGVVEHPFRRNFPPPPTAHASVFGVESLEDLQTHLGELRELLRGIARLKSRNDPQAANAVKAIGERACLEVAGFLLDRQTGRLVARWTTKEQSFRELLYAYLALTLTEVPYYHLQWCEACDRFFVDSSRRRVTYCSARCRNRSAVRRYRERHPERYRERQRELMRRRYAEGKRKDGGTGDE